METLKRMRCAAAGFCVLFACQAVVADGAVPAVEMSVNGFEFTPGGSKIAGGTAFNFTGTLVDPELSWVATWNFNASDQFDPGTSYIGGNFVIINISPETQQFELVVTMPTLTTTEDTFYTSSVIATVTGGASPGTGSTISGVPLWVASAANGGFSQALLDGSFSATAPPFGSGLLGSQLIQNQPGASLSNSMTITMRFEISSGASLSVTTLFAAVPAPGALAILAVAGLAARRRRL
jgi:hypothetical protein